MALQMRYNQETTASIKILDAAGNPATIDGLAQWATSAPGIVTLEPAADGMSCRIKGAAVGQCQVNVIADANLSLDEITNITAILDCNILGGEAVLIQIETGPVEDQTPAAMQTPGSATFSTKKK